MATDWNSDANRVSCSTAHRKNENFRRSVEGELVSRFKKGELRDDAVPTALSSPHIALTAYDTG